MSLITTGPPTHAPSLPYLEAADRPTTAATRSRPGSRSFWRRSPAGAAFDPASALAAQRFARLRDEQLRHGRW